MKQRCSGVLEMSPDDSHAQSRAMCKHSDFSRIVVSVSDDNSVDKHRLLSRASLSSHTGNSAVRSPWMVIMPMFSGVVEAFASLIAWPSVGRFLAGCSQPVAFSGWWSAGRSKQVALQRIAFSRSLSACGTHANLPTGSRAVVLSILLYSAHSALAVVQDDLSVSSRGLVSCQLPRRSRRRARTITFDS